MTGKADYTLKELVENNPIAELEQIGGPRELAGIAVRSASFQEYPSDDYIMRDELVLSTAAGCMEDTEGFIGLIALASEAGAAAIVYTIRDDGYAVPERVSRCADEAGLPVFRTPWKNRLSDINAFVANQIEQKKQQEYRRVQGELFNLFFESAPLSAALEKIALELKLPVAVADHALRVIAPSRFAGTDANADNMYRAEIRINDGLAGYLLIGNEENDRPGDGKTLGRFLLPPLSLWFYRKSIEDMASMKLKNNFIWDLAEGNYSELSEMKRQGRRLKFDLDRPYTCIALLAASSEEDSPIDEYSSAASRMAELLEICVQDVARSLGLRIMFADRSFQFVIYIENAPSNPEAALARFISGVEKTIDSFPGEYRFYWGLSETLREPSDFRRLYKNATLALQYCVRARGRRFTYKDTKEAQIISVLSASEEIRAEAGETLNALFEYGKNNRMDLVETLTEYISSNYNASMTSRRLHIHRQSLLYRLEKIEQLTGLSLSDHHDLFLLEVYSRIYADY